MKRIISISLILLLLAACQPTPTEEIVVNKAEGSLEQRIAGTAVPDYREEIVTVEATAPVQNETPAPDLTTAPVQNETQVPDPTTPPIQDETPAPTAEKTSEPVETIAPATKEPPKEPTLREALGVPERVQEKFDGNAVGAHLYIEIDAIADIPNVTRVPVLRGHILNEVSTEAERIAKLLLDGGPYLRPGRDWIARARKEMENKQAWIDALEDRPYGPYADYDMLRSRLEQSLQASADWISDPGNDSYRAPQVWEGSFADVREGIALGNETHSFSLTGDMFQYTSTSPYLTTIGMVRNRGPKNAEEQAMLDSAAAFGSSLGFTETAPRTINCFDETERIHYHTETGFDNGCYTFTLLPVYAGIPLYPYTTNYGSDTGLQAAGVHYDADKHQEQISGSLENGTVVYLQWLYPFRVTGTENENVALLPFDEIMNVFRRQVFMNQYLDKGCDETIHITDVRFSYMRVKIRDSEEYYLLPVWDFLGYEVDSEWDQKASPGELELARSWWNDQSLLTINAIDGSIINRNAGY